MEKISVLFLISLLSVFLKQGESLNCWNCMSELDRGCSDHFLVDHPGYVSTPSPDSHQLQPRMMSCNDLQIDHGYRYTCVKEKIYDRNTGNYLIHRSCASKRQDDVTATCPNFLLGESVQFCETCDHDFCNSGSTFKLTLALLLPVVTLILFKY